MDSVKFISYDGEYPNLCSGKLVLEINHHTVEFPNHTLISGGYVRFDENWNEEVGQGGWSVVTDNIPNEYKHLINQIVDVINESVPYGCCGGCV